MFAILVSFGWTVLSFVLRTVVLKALVFGLLLLVTTEFTQALISKLGSTSVDALPSALAGLPSGALWLMGVVRLDVGIPLILSAYVAAFAIRRIPLIG